jgi:hypothetical protein
MFKCQFDDAQCCARGASGRALAHSFLFGVLTVFGFCLILSRALAADSPAAAPDSLSHRYILMIETSRTMTHWARGVSTAINEILDSGLKSEGRAGDTLSVWTFNEDFNTNVCPQMELPLDPRAGFAAQVTKAIQGQPNDKKASLDKIVTEINALAQHTDFLTVILVSAGETDLHGTPFDARINQSFRKWQDEQKKARMPFVTAVRIGHGKFMQCSITPAQWPLELPPFPRELQFVPAKPAKRQVEPPGKGPKSEGPQYADVLTPAPPSSNTLAAAGSKGEIKATPTAIAKLAQDGVPKPAISPPPPTPVVARKEIQKPLPAATAPKPAEVLPADWKPLEETLNEWLASAKPAPAVVRGNSGPQQLPKLESAPAAAKASVQPAVARQKPAEAPLVISKPAGKSQSAQLTVADWQPLEDAMKNWRVEEKPPEPPAARIENTIKSAPAIIAVEVRPAQKPDVASQPSTLAINDPEIAPVPITHVDLKGSGESGPLSLALSSSGGEGVQMPVTISNAVSLPHPRWIGGIEGDDEIAAQKPIVAQLSPEPVVESRLEKSADDSTTAHPAVKTSAAVPLPKQSPVIAMRDEPVRPAENVFRKNAGLFAAMVVAGIAAVLCFLNWFRTIARGDTEEPVALSLTPENNLQPDRQQLETAAVESAALKALLDSVPASTPPPKRQPAIVRMAVPPSPSRSAAAKLAVQGHAA